MVFVVKEKMENDVLTMLIYGQKYHFKTLTSACIDKVRHLSVKELKQHKEEIEPDNYLQIARAKLPRPATQNTTEGVLDCLVNIATDGF